MIAKIIHKKIGRGPGCSDKTYGYFRGTDEELNLLLNLLKSKYIHTEWRLEPFKPEIIQNAQTVIDELKKRQHLATIDYPQFEFFGKTFHKNGYTLKKCNLKHWVYGKITWVYCFEKHAIAMFADEFDNL